MWGQQKTPATIPHSDQSGKEFRHRSFHAAGHAAVFLARAGSLVIWLRLNVSGFRLFWHAAGTRHAPRCELPARPTAGRPRQLASAVYGHACWWLCVPVAVHPAVPIGDQVSMSACVVIWPQAPKAWANVLLVDIADVGPLPTLPSPNAGERLHLSLAGRPPEKTIGRSMRNPSSPQRERFIALRRAAIDAMGGRKWYEGAVRVDLLYLGPEHSSVGGLYPYISGIFDTIGGSHGPSFIYLPIVYLDDGQVVETAFRRGIASAESYEIEIEFLENPPPSDP
jgi:hypothetical protein